VMSGEAEKAYKAGEMEMAAEAFKGLAASCKDCHTKYRN
jgi:cytochrome c556